MSVHDDPLWNIALDEFDLPNDKTWLDEWVNHCTRLAQPHTEPLGWGGGVTSTGTFVEPMRLQIGSPPQEDRETPRLWLVKQPGWEAPHLFVVGFSEVETPDLRFWPEVVRAAMEAVGTSDRAFDWYAVLGPSPNTSNGHDRIHLDTSGSLGPIQLQGEDAGYAEYDSASVRNLGAGGMVFEWWPIVASGTAHAYDWLVAERAVITADLHRACALLTLAWDRCLTVRWSAKRGEFHAVPEGPAGAVDEEMNALRRLVALPEWGDEAWRRLDGDDRLSDALAMYYEGCTLEAEHPSFALTAFISTVEWLKQLDKGAPRCPTCNLVTGSTQRYRDAVAEVLGPERAALAAEAYTPRSHTVHRATLHGDEKQVGLAVMGPMFEDAEKQFRWVTLRYPKEAAKKWLLRSLGAASRADHTEGVRLYEGDDNGN